MAITHTQTVTELTILNNDDNIVSEVTVKTVSVDDSDPSTLTIENEESLANPECLKEFELVYKNLKNNYAK